MGIQKGLFKMLAQGLPDYVIPNSHKTRALVDGGHYLFERQYKLYNKWQFLG